MATDTTTPWAEKVTQVTETLNPRGTASVIPGGICATNLHEARGPNGDEDSKESRDHTETRDVDVRVRSGDRQLLCLDTRVQLPIRCDVDQHTTNDQGNRSEHLHPARVQTLIGHTKDERGGIQTGGLDVTLLVASRHPSRGSCGRLGARSVQDTCRSSALQSCGGWRA